MSVKLFKNTEGKVLMSAGGKLIKQSYEFGNAFQNRMGLNNYINIKTENSAILNSAHTIIPIFSDTVLNFSSFACYLHNTLLAKSTYYRVVLSSTAYYYKFFNVVQSSSAPNEVASSLILSSILKSNNKLQFRNTAGSYSPTFTDTNIDFSIASIWVGAFSTVNATTPNFYTSSTAKLNRVLIYDRLLSDGEIKYIYNNKNGNDPQSDLGIIVDIHCNFAELLDFSADQDGSDMRVGCRDYSGFNRHGEIINIPGGDPATRLAWANTNLFVDFLS